MQQLLIATRNSHKTGEFAAILGPEFAVADLRSSPGFPEVEETGVTFAENAIIKAVAASRHTSGLVVADDSGLEVDALNGAPGVYSARYAGPQATDGENITKLLEELGAVRDQARRTARFVCVLALARNGKILREFSGVLEGRIAASTAGSDGFGYDPVFVPAGYAETLARLGGTVKNRISHRAAALQQLRAYLIATPLAG